MRQLLNLFSAIFYVQRTTYSYFLNDDKYTIHFCR